MAEKINMVDLFCGIGGLSLGFDKRYFNLVLGIDNDKDLFETFEKNHKNTPLIKSDIEKVSYDMLDANLKNTDVDVIVAGIPCQSFRWQAIGLDLKQKIIKIVELTYLIMH